MPSSPRSEIEFWKRKLAAYLHDPPSKSLDIPTHGERSEKAFAQAGFSDTDVGEYFAHADHTAAAMDRLPFPRASAGIQCAFDGVRNTFLHPLTGDKLPFHAEFKSAEQVFGIESAVQPVLSQESLSQLPSEAQQWRARFFAHWRLWQTQAADTDYRMGLLPADTRIPDHSIWTHMQVVSALAGCVRNDKVFQPAFLKFQLGPVQDFIAAARSVRDLWSGSYLLSWLMAAGMKVLSAEIGPDSVVFPNLRGQPLFDLHWRDELWSRVSISDQRTAWDSLAWKAADRLTPNLPNVFLALVPADRAAELARLVTEAIQAEWRNIADSVWNECQRVGLAGAEAGTTADARKNRYNSQVARFLAVSWQATPWPETLDEALKLAEGFDSVSSKNGLPIQGARNRVMSLVDLAQKTMPLEHRDGRYYVGGNGGPKTHLNNIGLGWSVILAFNAWELDAVRQTRVFDAANSGGWQVGTFSNKDVLTGREEAVAGGKTWSSKARSISRGPWRALFKHDDWLSAPTLIKRVWHFTYLAADRWGLETSSQDFPMPDTRSIARHDPFGRDDDPDNLAEMDRDSSEKYFAVLAFDGDEIGKWISGEKTPPFSSQLADYTDGSGNPGFGSKSYFQKPVYSDFLAQSRPLSPSYHLQFSEALSNFALLCARPVIEAFKGRLIYAGGDDVVGLLPADTVLACAQALRRAFQGLDVEHPNGGRIFSSPANGYLNSSKVDNQGYPIPFLVPGPSADCSVGVAIAHFKAPLQDVVRAAQTAEKRAKGGLDRKAVAVTLMKRSGETIEWGAKWEGGLDLYREIAGALAEDTLSSKFPHRLVELLEAYVTETTPLVTRVNSVQPVLGFPVDEVIRREFDHCLSRQRGINFPRKDSEAKAALDRLGRALEKHLESLPLSDPSIQEDQSKSTERRIRSLIGLCQTVALAHRTGVKANDHQPEPKGRA